MPQSQPVEKHANTVKQRHKLRNINVKALSLSLTLSQQNRCQTRNKLRPNIYEIPILNGNNNKQWTECARLGVQLL